MTSRIPALAVCCGLIATSLGVSRADPELPNGSAVVAALPMDGPYASLAAACNGDPDASCASARAARPCAARRIGGNLAGAFAAWRVLPGCEVALRTAKGWYLVSTDGLPAWAGFLGGGDRYASQIEGVTASADGKAALVRGVFVHSTGPEKMPWLAKPKRDGWYECEERLFVCAVGASGPSCAGPFPLVYTTYCRDGNHVEHALHLHDAHDFRFTATLHDHTLTVRGRSPRIAPLPGWAIVAADAARLAGVTRALSPEHVELRFP